MVRLASTDQRQIQIQIPLNTDTDTDTDTGALRYLKGTWSTLMPRGPVLECPGTGGRQGTLKVLEELPKVRLASTLKYLLVP